MAFSSAPRASTPLHEEPLTMIGSRLTPLVLTSLVALTACGPGRQAAWEQQSQKEMTAPPPPAEGSELNALLEKANAAWAERGDRIRAHDLLAPVLRWFTEGSEMPDLVEAKALLGGLC